MYACGPNFIKINLVYMVSQQGTHSLVLKKDIKLMSDRERN